MATLETQKYSQHDEERYILEVLRGLAPETAHFLDIGAWHPTCLSNTRALVERGWSGMMIEPSPQPFLNLLDAYGASGKITLLLGAIGLESCIAPMWITDDAVSTLIETEYEVWRKHANFRGQILVPVITLDQLFHQYGGDWQFINIDAEGISPALFKRLLKIGVRPRCICVEHNQQIVELAGHAQCAGYRQVYLNGTNVVYSV